MRKLFIFAIITILFSVGVHATLTDGLSAYWNFDSSTITDSTGAHNGTKNGVTQYTNTSSKLGGSLDIPITGNVSVGTNVITNASGFSVNAWVKRRNVYGSYAGDHYFNPLTTNSNPQFYTGWYSGAQDSIGIGKVGVDDINGIPGSQYSTLTPFNSTYSWFMITWVSTSGTDLKMYSNGSSIINVTKSLAFSVGAAMYIGGISALSSPMNGSIDEMGVWNRALSQAEITQLFNGGAGLTYPFTGTPPSTECNSTGTNTCGDCNITTATTHTGIVKFTGTGTVYVNATINNMSIAAMNGCCVVFRK